MAEDGELVHESVVAVGCWILCRDPQGSHMPLAGAASAL